MQSELERTIHVCLVAADSPRSDKARAERLLDRAAGEAESRRHLCMIAETYHALARYDKAVSLADRALRVPGADDEAADVYIVKGLALVKMGAAFASQGSPQAAGSCYRAALETIDAIFRLPIKMATSRCAGLFYKKLVLHYHLREYEAVLASFLTLKTQPGFASALTAPMRETVKSYVTTAERVLTQQRTERRFALPKLPGRSDGRPN